MVSNAGNLVKLPLSSCAAALALAASAPLLAACGPKEVDLNPLSVVDVQVRPASGQRLFCPGDRFQVELVAKLKDGSTCSSTDRTRGCMGQKDAVIRPTDVRIEASAGGRGEPPEQFIWIPPSNPLDTADTGLVLRGWLERTMGGQPLRSVQGETELKPVYQCQMAGEYGEYQGGYQGEHGVAGPNVDIAITTLSTPYYPAAALIRVETMGGRFYYISPSVDQAVRITSRGQNGAVGGQGEPGQNGEDGKDAAMDAPACTRGGDGKDGADGGRGGRGGDGGDGGRVRITLDEAAVDRLRGRVLTDSLGGSAGPGGPGGAGGRGGAGGSGGPSKPECSDTSGKPGQAGRNGQAGRPGRPGLPGPPPEVTTASRASLFAPEMATITRIEAARARPQ